MTRPIAAPLMLRTAAKLGGRGAGPGRPPLCDLRRSTSTAYYALFHQLTRHAALIVVPGAGEQEIARVARWLSHTGLREAARLTEVAAGARDPRQPDEVAVALLRGARRPVPDELDLVARTFRRLQNVRHKADYDNAYEPGRSLTLEHVRLAEEAVQAAESLWRGSESSRPERRAAHDVYRRFLLLALLSSGGPKSRR